MEQYTALSRYDLIIDATSACIDISFLLTRLFIARKSSLDPSLVSIQIFKP